MKGHPVTHGAIVASASLGTFHMTEASYEPGKVVPVHEHLRAGWTLTLDGVYNERFRRYEHVAPPGSVLGKPATARHSNRFGPRGARCFLIGVDTDHPGTHQGVAQALREVTFHAQGPVPAIVRRMHREFVAQEAAWTLVLEGLILDLSAQVMRVAEGAASKLPPRWLVRVREQIHASFAETPTFESLAAVAGVHPVHLSRAFRAAYGSTPGHYLREVRVDHAKRLLVRSGLPIAQVAAAIGYCDQSHFTRAFRRATGMTPAAYRRRRSA